MREHLKRISKIVSFKLGLIIVAVILFVLALHSCVSNPNGKPWELDYKTDACLIPMKSGEFYVCDNLEYKVGDKDILIPMLFKTDLASIPRLFWAFYSPFDFQYISPAILHDYLYSCPNDLSRKDVDDIFYYSLIHSGSDKFTASLFWLTVRVFGSNRFLQDKDCNGSYIENFEEPDESPAHYFISKHTESETEI